MKHWRVLDMSINTATMAPVPDRLYRPGLEIRARVLAELASRWEEHLPDLSERELAGVLGVDRNALRYHLTGLREDGLLHESRVSLTRAGYEAARDP